jgi:hypothetical protein
MMKFMNLRHFSILIFIFLVDVEYNMGQFTPGQPAPEFQVPTFNGTFHFVPKVFSSPIIFHAYDSDSAFVECMWSDDSSVDDFLVKTPLDAHFLIASYSQNGITIEVNPIH